MYLVGSVERRLKPVNNCTFCRIVGGNYIIWCAAFHSVGHKHWQKTNAKVTFKVKPPDGRATYLLSVVFVCLWKELDYFLQEINTRWLPLFVCKKLILGGSQWCLFVCLIICLWTDYFCKKLTQGGSQNWFQMLTLDDSLRCDTMLSSILVLWSLPTVSHKQHIGFVNKSTKNRHHFR